MSTALTPSDVSILHDIIDHPVAMVSASRASTIRRLARRGLVAATRRGPSARWYVTDAGYDALDVAEARAALAGDL